MKIRTYIRVARNPRGRKGHVITANPTPKYSPLTNSTGRYLPTAMFALDLDVPEEMFRQAEQVLAEVVIDKDDLAIAAQVVRPRDVDRSSN